MCSCTKCIPTADTIIRHRPNDAGPHRLFIYCFPRGGRRVLSLSRDSLQTTFNPRGFPVLGSTVSPPAGKAAHPAASCKPFGGHVLHFKQTHTHTHIHTESCRVNCDIWGVSGAHNFAYVHNKSDSYSPFPTLYQSMTLWKCKARKINCLEVIKYIFHPPIWDDLFILLLCLDVSQPFQAAVGNFNQE